MLAKQSPFFTVYLVMGGTSRAAAHRPGLGRVPIPVLLIEVWKRDRMVARRNAGEVSIPLCVEVAVPGLGPVGKIYPVTLSGHGVVVVVHQPDFDPRLFFPCHRPL